MKTTQMNMTRRRVKVLALLRAKNRGPSVRDMCESLGGVTPNAVHEVLRQARDAGLAETDGKAGGWHLTEHGEKVVRMFEAVLGEVDAMRPK